MLTLVIRTKRSVHAVTLAPLRNKNTTTLTFPSAHMGVTSCDPATRSETNRTASPAHKYQYFEKVPKIVQLEHSFILEGGAGK